MQQLMRMVLSLLEGKYLDEAELPLIKDM